MSSKYKIIHGFTGAISIKRSSLPKSSTLSPTTALNINGKNIGVNKLGKNSEKSKLNEPLNDKSTNYGTMTEDEDEDDDDAYLAANVTKNESKLSTNNSSTNKLSLGMTQSNSNNNQNYKSQANDEGDKISGLSDMNFVFRGSKLVNTEYIYALVLFVGRETKLMLNRNQVPFKFSKFEKILNQMILSILIFNFILCVAFGIAANVVIEPYPLLIREPWIRSFALDTCSWLILTSWMIPFSLYVTLELVKMIQAQWVAWDEKMTYDPDPHSKSNSSSNSSSSTASRAGSPSDINSKSLSKEMIRQNYIDLHH